MHALSRVAAAMLALALVPAAAGTAGAWTRTVDAYGPRGAERHASRSCSGGACSFSASGQTRSGDSWSRSRAASCDGAGTCSVSRSGIAPNGNSWSRSRTVTRD